MTLRPAGQSPRPGVMLALVGALGLAPVLASVPTQVVAQEAASAVQDVTLQDIVLTYGETKVSAATITVSGTRLSKDDLLAILKSEGKEPWSERFARLEAGSFTTPELRVERTHEGVRQATIYRDVAAKGVHRGKIDELTASGASLSLEGGERATSGKGSYGKLRAEDVDLAALTRVAGEPGDGKGPLQRLYATFSMEAVEFGDEQTRVTFASVRGRDFSARQIPSAWNGAVDTLSVIDFEKADPAERAKASGVLADIAEGFTVGSIEANDFTIKTTEPEEGDLRIGSIVYSGTGPDAGIAFGNFSFAGSGTKLSLATLKISGVSLEPTIAGLRKLAQTTNPSSADMRRLMPQVGTASLTGFSLDIPQEVKATPAPDPLHPAKPAAPGTMHLGLREVALKTVAVKDGLPIDGRVTVGGLTLPAAMLADIPGLAALGSYGYRDIDLDLVADTAWNEASKELTLREVSLSGKDMGSVRIAGTLGGIGPEVFDPDSAVSGYAMLATTAKALDLTVQNGGLFERFIDATSKSLSLKPDELRKEYVTASVIGVPVILGNSPAAKSIGAAMGKFVTKPGKLTITAKAKNGTGLGVVDFSTAPTPAALMDKLDVDAKAE